MLGAFRTGDGPAPNGSTPEQERLVLYFSHEELEEAQRQAIRTGLRTPQSYCESIVRRDLETARVAFEVEEAERRHGRFEGLRAVADDPDYLAEWTAARPVRPQGPPDVRELTVIEPSRESVIRRHAGLEPCDESLALLPSLRVGRWLRPESAEELIEALAALEESLDGQSTIDRALCYALHKLAFEGQIHASESPVAHALGAEAILVLRRVQEGVDRILSGQDIRYDARDSLH